MTQAKTKVTVTEYDACDDCAYYLATGDSSAIELQDDSDETLATIDATLAAILADEHTPGAYVLETLGQASTESSYRTCGFCGDVVIGMQAVRIAENS